MKVALWARYSSKMQDDMSIEAQVYEMEAHCAKLGWEIVERYMLPEVRSADLDKAPEFQRMIEDAKAKRFKTLLCHKLDRLGRDREMVVLFKAGLRRQGIEIRSVIENLSDSLEDRMLEGMIELFSDYYSKNLGVETRKGHRQLVRQGFWRGGTPPWGLTTEVVDSGGKKPHKRLVACPVRGPLMVEVFRRMAAGETPEKIRRWVANQTSDAEWQPQSFYARIHNPTYYGRLEYGRTSLPAGRPRKQLKPEDLIVGEWEGLVPKDLWDAANAMLEQRKRKYCRAERKVEEPYLLSGLLRCSDCGSSITGEKSGGWRRYRCTNRKCGNRSCRAEVLEKYTLTALKEAMANQSRETLTFQASAQLEPVRDDSRREESRLRSELSELKVKRGRLLAAIEAGADPSQFVDRLAQIKAEEAQLVDAIGTSQVGGDARANLDLTEFLDLWDELLETLPSDPDIADLRIMLQHGFEVEISLQKQEGQLYFKLAPERRCSSGLFMVGVHRLDAHRESFNQPYARVRLSTYSLAPPLESVKSRPGD